MVAASVVDGDTSHMEQILLVPVFAAAVVLADLLAQALRRRGVDVGRLMLLAQCVLLLAVTVIAAWLVPSSNPHGAGAFLIAVLAVMATQNALLHLSEKQAPSTSTMTNNFVAALTALIALSRDDDAEARRVWRATWPLLGGFFVGCLLGTAAVSGSAVYAWIAPAAVAIWVALRSTTGRSVSGR